MPPTSLEELIQLQAEKREEVQSLFSQKQAIEQKLERLHRDLLKLDDAIDIREEQEHQGQVQPDHDVHGPQHSNTSLEQLVDVEDEQAMAAMTQHPEEHLTDPREYLAQTQEQRRLSATLQPQLSQVFESVQDDDPIEQTQERDASSFGYGNDDDRFPHDAASRRDYHENRLPTDNVLNVDITNADSASLRPIPPPLVLQQVATKKQSRKRTRETFFDPITPASHKNRGGDLDSSSRITTVSPASSSSAAGGPFSEQDILKCLQQTFHIQAFRENQLDIIQQTLAGNDCFVLMRTGGGKSLTYQLPAALELWSQKKVTVVVSPLLSLIEDQEDQMNDFVPGSAVRFTSGLGASAHNDNWRRVRDPHGGVAMIFVTPERVYQSNKIKSELQQLHNQQRLGRFVIDECHCACQWGHDFRPDYAKLGVLKRHFPEIPCLAVTATASNEVRQDCIRILEIPPRHKFFRSSANRLNLHYQVRPKESAKDVLDDMVEFIQSCRPQQAPSSASMSNNRYRRLNDRTLRAAGIVYTFSKKDADNVADQLCERGIVARSYHSDVSANNKSEIHKSWMRNETQVVVATIAFGLGINKPDVRFVLHHTLSKNVEAYYQESGRAGRDGLSADCVLYYSPRDVPRMLKLTHGDSASDKFWLMVKYAQQFGSDRICRAIIMEQLGEPNQNVEHVLQTAESDPRTELKDVVTHVETVLRLLFSMQDDKTTMAMLLKEWRSKPASAPECVRDNPPGKDLSVSDCERIIVALICCKLIETDIRWTSYSAVVYLRGAVLAERFLTSENKKKHFNIRLPKKKTMEATTAATARRLARTSEDGWIQTSNSSKTATKPKANRKKAPPQKKRATTGRKITKKSVRAGKKAAHVPKVTPYKNITSDIIEIDDDDDSDALEILPPATGGTSTLAKTNRSSDYAGDTSEEEFS